MWIINAHKGGCFYGCSQWPTCKGYRNKHNKGPGPAAMIIKLRDMHVDAVWKEMEDMRKAGKSPFNHPQHPRGNGKGQWMFP